LKWLKKRGIQWSVKWKLEGTFHFFGDNLLLQGEAAAGIRRATFQLLAKNSAISMADIDEKVVSQLAK
jgi:hypothetical protein